MTRYLFRNRQHRLFFQFLDAFARSGCGLCALLKEFDRTLMTSFFDADKKTSSRLEDLCAAHKFEVAQFGRDEQARLAPLKAAVRNSLNGLAHRGRNPILGWRRCFASHPVDCALCAQLVSEEKSLCIGLVRFLEDMEFWKGFSGAPLLCMGHLQKCLALAKKGAGAKRLRDDQSAKLNGLLNELVRFEATGTRGEVKAMALDWLGGLGLPSPEFAHENALSAEAETVGTMASDARPDEPPDDEQLLFENEKLARQVRNLLNRLNEVESRAASLHYRVSRLSEDNKRLEMGYTGANAQAHGLKELVQELRAQIKQLQNGTAEVSKAGSQTT